MSITIIGLLVAVLSSASRAVGVDLDDGKLTEFVLTGVQLAGVAAIYWGRVRKGDITIFGIRKR